VDADAEAETEPPYNQAFDSQEEALEVEDDEDDGERSSTDIETGELSLHRLSSGYSRTSVDQLLRSNSAQSDSSHTGRKMSQKIYIVNEDLTIVVAGFKTHPLRYPLFICVCILTFGLAYLLLRWLPRWRVRFIGSPCPLRDSKWVVIEVCHVAHFL
jgi:cation-transporting ATPase 13A3/4/5